MMPNPDTQLEMDIKLCSSQSLSEMFELKTQITNHKDKGYHCCSGGFCHFCYSSPLGLKSQTFCKEVETIKVSIRADKLSNVSFYGTLFDPF